MTSDLVAGLAGCSMLMSRISSAFTAPALSGVFNGVESWSHAIAAGSIRVDGAPLLVRALPRWFLGSPFTPLVAEQAARRRGGRGETQSNTMVRLRSACGTFA